ncbi:F-box/LRR-repeat protein 20 [Nowakowskiella sp. JEL0407]|nr:F-box/LRR-repeat protein 20 [Nowakowskiella sp. JEL0407]
MDLIPEEYLLPAMPVTFLFADKLAYKDPATYDLDVSSVIPEEKTLTCVLPFELCLKIFRFLDLCTLIRASRVSHDWKRVAFDGSLWTKIDIFPFRNSITSWQLSDLARHAGKFLRSVNFRGCLQVSSHVLSIFAAKCTNLEEIRLSGCRSASTASILQLVRATKNVSVLDFAGLMVVNNTTCEAVGKCCPNLSFFDVSYCKNVTATGVASVVAGCPGISRLYLSNCAGVNDEFMTCVAKLTELVVLDLSYCASLNEDSVVTLAKGNSGGKLEHLRLSGCIHLSDQALRAIAQYCLSLKFLELSGCRLLTDEGLIPIVQQCSKLENLDIEECVLITDNLLSAIGSHLSLTITHLCLGYCDLITDSAVLSLIRSCNLTTLEIDNCSRITNNLIKDLAENLPPKLREISLYDCRGLNYTSIKSLQKSTSTAAAVISAAKSLREKRKNDKIKARMLRNEKGKSISKKESKARRKRYVGTEKGKEKITTLVGAATGMMENPFAGNSATLDSNEETQMVFPGSFSYNKNRRIQEYEYNKSGDETEDEDLSSDDDDIDTLTSDTTDPPTFAMDEEYENAIVESKKTRDLSQKAGSSSRSQTSELKRQSTGGAGFPLFKQIPFRRHTLAVENPSGIMSRFRRRKLSIEMDSQSGVSGSVKTMSGSSTAVGSLSSAGVREYPDMEENECEDESEEEELRIPPPWNNLGEDYVAMKIGSFYTSQAATDMHLDDERHGRRRSSGCNLL